MGDYAGSVGPIANENIARIGQQQKHSARVEHHSNFAKVLKTSMQIKFSAHAKDRMASRNIVLSNDDLKLIQQGTAKAASKGARDSLLLLDDLGLIVNVKNKTVLTAIDKQSMQDRVFTNIDSTIILKR